MDQTSEAPKLEVIGPPPARAPYRRRTFTFLGVIAVLLVLWEASGLVFAYTDDAILTSDLVAIAPQVTGPIQTVTVSDNQTVQPGDLIFTIDPTPFRLLLDQANDALSAAQSRIAVDQTSSQSALALQRSAQARAIQAEADLARARNLAGAGFEAPQAEQDATTAAQQAADALSAAQDAVLRASRVLRLDQFEIAAATSAQALAQWRLHRTRVLAPVAGRVVHFTLLPGDSASAGKPVVALVASDAWYVNANYKESVIRHLKPGRIGWVWLDTHPFHLYRARIEGIAGGIDRSKTRLGGLLPYSDPTIDWIRLEARFPVRFQLLDLPPEAERFMGSDARTIVFY
ncbi:MAG TPA: HlyD family secretion protein [Acidisoma sp.]|uniref:HlyD family secretion protein n=1 Tax=Acidisoma sp. TaxID=1872115 RepID=UPI002BDACF91|nr:HlyD family secretion protein [Acidisoma sp.]HTI01816.1 HlyD family secretion protein [Acidisoma sp.]